MRLQTVDGNTSKGFMFAPSDIRVSDAVNSTKPFLPFVHGDGQFSPIAKAMLIRVTPYDAQAHNAQRLADGAGKTPTDLWRDRAQRKWGPRKWGHGVIELGSPSH